jgi:choice-of-anchor C domain-containing protein
MKRHDAPIGFLKSALLVALACGVAIPASANLVQNGSFNCPTCSGAFQTLPGGDTSITGWTVTNGGTPLDSNGSVDWIATYWQQPPGGGFSLDLDGNAPGGVTQTVTGLTSGVTYDLTFYLSGNPDGSPSDEGSNPADKLVNVAAGPLTEQFNYNVVTFGNSESDMKWEAESFIFTASASSTTISFTSADPDGNPWGPAIGGISLNATPEPAFYGALLIGLAGLFYAMRRRSQA